MSLRDAGRTIVIAAHSPAVLAIADRVVTLANGQIATSEVRPGPIRAVTRQNHPANTRPFQPEPAVA